MIANENDMIKYDSKKIMKGIMNGIMKGIKWYPCDVSHCMLELYVGAIS